MLHDARAVIGRIDERSDPVDGGPRGKRAEDHVTRMVGAAVGAVIGCVAVIVTVFNARGRRTVAVKASRRGRRSGQSRGGGNGRESDKSSAQTGGQLNLGCHFRASKRWHFSRILRD